MESVCGLPNETRVSVAGLTDLTDLTEITEWYGKTAENFSRTTAEGCTEKHTTEEHTTEAHTTESTEKRPENTERAPRAAMISGPATIF